MLHMIRRVVAGLDSSGRSTIVSDGAPSDIFPSSAFPAHAVTLLWDAGTLPTTNDGETPPAKGKEFRLAEGGARLLLWEYPPLRDIPHEQRSAFLANPIGLPIDNRDHPGFHATQSLDWLIVLRGELTVILEKTETILHPGELFIDRGVVHAWENRGTVPTIAIVANLDARPIANMAATLNIVE